MTSVKETLWGGDEATLTQYVKNRDDTRFI